MERGKKTLFPSNLYLLKNGKRTGYLLGGKEVANIVRKMKTEKSLLPVLSKENTLHRSRFKNLYV
jgi:hypothetical protein